jgi:type IV secretion system protein VirB4
MAYVTATVTVWDRDPAIAAEKLRLVEKVIQGRDFTVIPEGMNAIEAWLGACPATSTPMSASPDLHHQSRPPDPPVSSMGGAGTGRAFRCAPLLYGKTEGSTPFRFPFMSAMSATR